MEVISANLNRFTDRPWYAVLQKFMAILLVSWQITVSYFQSHRLKAHILSNCVVREKYRLSFYKILQDLWLDKNMNEEE